MKKLQVGILLLRAVYANYWRSESICGSEMERNIFDWVFFEEKDDHLHAVLLLAYLGKSSLCSSCA